MSLPLKIVVMDGQRFLNKGDFLFIKTVLAQDLHFSTKYRLARVRSF